MGHIIHHAIVVTSYDEKLIAEAHAYAVELGCAVSSIVPSAVNGDQSFMIAPDGSKSGWEASDAGDDQRNSFVQWALSKRYSDLSSPLAWVEVAYGSDDRHADVTRHEWQRRRKAPAVAASRSSQGANER